MITDPITVAPDQKISDAQGIMNKYGISGLPVTKNGRLVGILTNRDLRFEKRHDRPVSEVMTPDPESLGRDDGIGFALNRMVVGGFRHIPIVDDKGGAPRLLSQRDVVAFIVARMPKRVLNLPPEPHLEARTPDGG